MKTDLRVVLTRRLLKEGLFRMLEEKPLSRISITDLCRVSGVNRATFYNHYDSPVRILEEIAYDYFYKLRNIYRDSVEKGHDTDAAVTECLTYLRDRKKEIKLLFSPNAENCIIGFSMDVVNTFVAENASRLRGVGSETDRYLTAVITSSALFGLIQAWIVQDIDKTPEELVTILNRVLMNPYTG